MAFAFQEEKNMLSIGDLIRLLLLRVKAVSAEYKKGVYTENSNSLG